MGQEKLPAYIQYLLEASSYSHQADEIQLLQTHISFVVLAGLYAYKWKKPVNMGFLDFSTLEKRKYFCNQEIILNRRLCPEVYLDVARITRQGDSFCLNGHGEIVEYGVLMARLPEDRMMGRIMERRLLARSDIERIVAKLVPFYERADKSEEVNSYGSATVVAENILGNLSQVEPFIDHDILGRRQFERIRDFTTNFIGHEELFTLRQEEGRICDCHGDLHSGNICLVDEVCIFDCIEFSDRLRYGDVAADVAFLAMDLDLHGFEELSGYFIERFIDCSEDPMLLSILDFYKCYRACVRGKINLLTAITPTLATEVALQYRAQAKRCFTLAQSYVPVS